MAGAHIKCTGLSSLWEVSVLDLLPRSWVFGVMTCKCEMKVESFLLGMPSGRRKVAGAVVWSGVSPLKIY